MIALVLLQSKGAKLSLCSSSALRSTLAKCLQFRHLLAPKKLGRLARQIWAE